ncbi:acyltransferase family protein [Dactylosporangium fulvum]|uniref:Acyltransferase n=1 Tax=Dactylosporangium fulvum TaxID=53359 RepID=A0ABY5WE95_9ACTN|nr:acyltransferase [Dactylosporangium fulvum]UWP87739.1 acyltransferase [Dactylosporangium fulvum]
MTYDEFRALRRFPALDGLRAIAALMVVMFHFGGSDWQWLSGHSGVHIFFVLSGFLITTLALREEEQPGRISFVNFYLRRLFRIVPVYLVVLLAMAVHFAPPGALFGDLNGGMPYYLTFMNEFSTYGIFTISWTLGIEQKFYLVWPLVAFAAGVIPLGRRLGVTIGLIAAAAVAATLSRDLYIHYIPILIGCLLAILAHHPRGFAVIRPLTHPIVGTALALGFIGVQLALDSANNAFGGVRVIPWYALCVALVLPGLLARTPGTWLLSTRVLGFIGERSYSLYLVQVLAGAAVLWLVEVGNQLLGTGFVLNYGNTRAILVAIVSLVMADVLYRLVEQPCIKLGRRIVAWRRSRREASAGHRPAPTDAPAGLGTQVPHQRSAAETAEPNVASAPQR